MDVSHQPSREELEKLVRGDAPVRTGPGGKCLMDRRSFLLLGGAATTVVMVGMPGAEARSPAVVAETCKRCCQERSSRPQTQNNVPGFYCAR